jgi:hypothetical protein
VWVTSGVIQLRLRQEAGAREAFSRALALSGLALCEDTRHVPTAVDTYRAARKISKDAGVTASVLKLFDALVEVDADGILIQVRKAAAAQ